MSSAHVPAKYKIEVHFNKNRTTAGPNTAAITIFESGARLNGEGDELVYLCTAKDAVLRLTCPACPINLLFEVKVGAAGNSSGELTRRRSGMSLPYD